MRRAAPLSDHSDHIPQWKIAVAAGVVAVVAAAVAIIALMRGVVPGGDAEPANPAPASPSPAPAEESEVVASIRTALDAWEAFARSADLDGVDKAFVVDGPQYRQFKREARNGQAGVERVPGFALQSIDAIEPAGQRRRVTTHVALRGEDGPPDVREWVFVLQRVAGSWRVWTVIDRTGT